MISRPAAVLLCLAVSAVRPAGAQDPWTTAQRLMRQADSSLGRENSASARAAIDFSRRALRVLGQPVPGERWILGRPNVFIAQGFLQLGQLDSMVFYERRALGFLRGSQDREALAVLHQDLAKMHLGLGRADSALANLKLGLAHFQASRGANTGAGVHIWMATAYEQLGQPDSARIVLLRAADLAAAEGDPFFLATAHRLLGRLWMSGILGGGGDSALVYFRKSWAVYQQGRVVKGAASLLSDMAEVFRASGVLDSSLKYGYAALQVYRRVTREDGEGVIVLRQLAKTWAEAGELLEVDSALAYGRAAVELARSMGNAGHEADALADFGGMLLRTRKDSATVILRQALGMYQKLSNKDGILKANLFLGWAMLAPATADSAAAHFTVARDGLLSTNPANAAQAAAGLAVAEYVAGRYQAAANGMAAYFALKSGRRKSAGDDFLRIASGDYNATLIDEIWTRAWLAQAPVIGNDRAVLGALAATDRARAQALLDLMEVPDSAAFATGDYPGSGKRLLDRALEGADLVLYYRIGGDTLAVWAGARGAAPVLARVAVSRDTLEATISRYLGALGVRQGTSVLAARGLELERGSLGVVAAGGEAAVNALGRRLSAWVLPPELREMVVRAREVVIVPHGALGLLPFGALPEPGGTTPLGTARGLRFAPSLGSLDGATSRPVAWSGRAELGGKSLVVGNPQMPSVPAAGGGRSGLSPLPGAESEGREVARRIGVEPLIGAAATETVVRRRLGTAAIAHLATHGYAYSAAGDAGRSFIALAPDGASDGLLTVAEIVNSPDLRLSADLVVLSACQTGLGNLREAEGTVGLQRAFLGRGARSVLVSLWNVSDAATRLLMERFYAHWLDDGPGVGKAEALRRAQEDVRRTKGFEQPKFWAAFQLVGAN